MSNAFFSPLVIFVCFWWVQSVAGATRWARRTHSQGVDRASCSFCFTFASDMNQIAVRVHVCDCVFFTFLPLFLFLGLSLAELMSGHAMSYDVWCSVKGCSRAVRELKCFTALWHWQNRHSGCMLAVCVCVCARLKVPFLSFYFILLSVPCWILLTKLLLHQKEDIRSKKYCNSAKQICHRRFDRRTSWTATINIHRTLHSWRKILKGRYRATVMCEMKSHSNEMIG